MGLRETYEEKVASGALKRDAAQARLVARLATLAHDLDGYEPEGAGFFLKRLMNGGGRPAPRGLYIVGDVGRGKTMLMDMLYAEANVAKKRRIHFHAFMQDVHARLHRARQNTRERDALLPVVRALAEETHLLCLDEMQIADIADAMIVGRLFEGLIKAGTVIVTTSNTQPRDLYREGLNRQLFLPFIALLEEHLDIVTLDSDRDYRLGRIRGRETFITPLGPDADRAIQQLWEKLTDTEHGKTMSIDLLGRTLVVPQAAHGAARFTFADLCEAPLGAADYLAIATNFATIFIEHVPVLTPEMRDPAKRFILLIDTLYDRGRKLIASAAAPPADLYPGGHHESEFARTASRLQEMQSAGWWVNKIAET